MRPVTKPSEMERTEDAECDRILAMSSEEILAHCIVHGIDPAKVDDEFERLLGSAKAEAYRRRMHL
jgi:hypothetical protein